MKNFTSKFLGIFGIIMLFGITYVLAQDGDISTNDEQTILQIMLNGMNPKFFFAMMIYAIIGAVANLISDTTRRKKPSTYSPVKFSFKYWWDDNWRRIILTILLVPIAIVMCDSMLGMEINGLNAFFIGFSSDHLSEILKRKNIVVKGLNNTGSEG